MLNQIHQKLSAVFAQIEPIILECAISAGIASCQLQVTFTLGLSLPPENSTDRLLTQVAEEPLKESTVYGVKAAAKFLKASIKTVYNMRNDGRLLSISAGKRPKFIRSELEKAAPSLRKYAKNGRI